MSRIRYPNHAGWEVGFFEGSMYLEIDEGFDSHPKTVRLCRVMGDVNAGQYLIRLWAWACRSAQDGDLSGMESADIEAIARYAPSDGKLFTALSEKWSPKFGPWIDVDGESVRLHGWSERQGAAISRMSKRASDMRALRERRKSERDSNVAATLPNRDTHVGDQTRPDQTRQDKTSPDKTRKDPEEDCAETAKPSSPPAPPVPALLVFPCDGKPNEWHLTKAAVTDWQKLFPTLDIVDQCREALAWIEASPTRRKTTSGMPRFLVNWFTRTKNNPPRVASALPSRTDYGGHPARATPPTRQPLPNVTPTAGWTQKEKDMAKDVAALTSAIAKATEPQHEGTT